MIPQLIDVHGQPLRQSMGYTGGGAGFGGQMADWTPPSQSADEALLPQFRLGNARADDLVRNNGLAANAIDIHKNHIVGNMFRLSYRPNWKFLGMKEEDAQAFADDVEAAWLEYVDAIDNWIDIEQKHDFTGLIRDAVGIHAFAGEIFMQPVTDHNQRQLFTTRFMMVSPKRIENPYNGMSTSQRRNGVDIDRNGAAIAYHVRESDLSQGEGAHRYRRIRRFFPTGRPGMIHVFQPTEPHQTRGANRFYSIMERLKMLDTLQATQLQSAVVKSMYAATIESELNSEKALEFIAGAEGTSTKSPLTKMLSAIGDHYARVNVKLGGVKIPHLYPGDKLSLQTAQNADNGFAALEQSILRYIAAGLGVSYEQLSRDYSKVSYSSARASANESWRYFMGQRKQIAARLATQMFSCWLEEVIVRGIVVPPPARLHFMQARSSWSRAEWIGAGRMAIDGLKEVQESVMLIEGGLSTYEKELAKLGEDYQEIFRQQVRESQEREAAGLRPPAWIASTYNQQIEDSRQPEGNNNAAT